MNKLIVALCLVMFFAGCKKTSEDLNGNKIKFIGTDKSGLIVRSSFDGIYTIVYFDNLGERKYTYAHRYEFEVIGEENVESK